MSVSSWAPGSRAGILLPALLIGLAAYAAMAETADAAVTAASPATIAAGTPASTVIGAKLRDNAGRTVGRVVDLIATGERRGVSHVVVRTGGVLGMGGRKATLAIGHFADLDATPTLAQGARDRLRQQAGDDTAARRAGALPVSLLLRAWVYDGNGSRLGEVEDLVIAPDGSITAAIVDIGGFMGVGEHRIAIPPRYFHEADGRATLPGASKKELMALPSAAG